MRKGSTASAQTLMQPPSQSAWARDLPQNNSSGPSTHSQSPSPSHIRSITASHSRHPSALGQGVRVKEGVTVPRNIVGSVRQRSSLHFGSIDDATAPVSSSPTATPVVRHESVKAFGSLPVIAPPTYNIVNGTIPASSPTPGPLKSPSRHTPASPSIPSSISAAASSLSVLTTMTSSMASAAAANITPSSSSSGTSSTSTPSSSTKPAFNVAKLFQGNLSASQPSSGTTSPSSRPSSLAHQSSSASQHSPQPPVHAPPLSAHPYTPFAQGMRPPHGTSGPGSPAFSRAVPNRTGPQSPPISGSGRPGGSPIPASPTLTPPAHLHPPSSAGVPPQKLPVKPIDWPYYYHLEYSSSQRYHPMQPPHGTGHTPHTPGPTPQDPPHPGIPLSPRTQPPPLPPGTPSMTHAVPHSPHTPQPPRPHAHQPSPGVSMTPPPPTPSTSTAPGGRSLNPNATTFDPTSTRLHKITIKSEDGKELRLESFKKPSPQPSTTPIPRSSPIVRGRRTASVRFESKKAKWKREEQARIEQERQEAEERAKQGEEERKRKEEEAANRREEEKQEEKREEKEGEQERAHKAEEETLRQEEERKRRAEEEWLEEEQCIEERLRVEKERQGRERRKREQAELDERERTERETERQRQEEAEAETRKDGDIVEFPTQELLEVEEGKVIDNGEVLEPQMDGASNLSRSQKESSHIDTSKFVRRQLGPTDMNAAKEDSSAPPLSALLTARKIDRLNEVEYPEGIRSPKTELNENAKDGKFRYDLDFLLQFTAICKEKPPNLLSPDMLGIEPIELKLVEQSSSRGGSGRHRPPSGRKSAERARSTSIGLGLSPSKRGPAGPLDINAAKKDSFAPPLSALLTAHNIDRLDEVEYSEGITSPKTELNQNAKDGKFRYDRDFLLQFMVVCKERPPNLSSRDIFGLEPVDWPLFGMTRSGSGRHRPPSGPKSAAGARSTSIDLRHGPFKSGPAPGPFPMGQFGTAGTKLMSGERIRMPQGARSASVGGDPAAASLSRPALTQTPSQGGPGGRPKGGHRTRSKRGMKRTDPGKVGSVQQIPGDVSEVSFA